MSEKNELDSVVAMLTRWLTSVKLRNSVNDTGINRTSENLVLRLLNESYGYNLTNLNWENSNYPAVDLGDYKRGIAFQVTATVTLDKIMETLIRFYNQEGPCKEFTKGLYFFFLKEKAPRLNAKTKQKLEEIAHGFKPAQQMWSMKTLLTRMEVLYSKDRQRFIRVKAILEEEFGGSLRKVSLSKLPVTGTQVYGREKELEILDKAWVDEQINIVTLVAWGGVGKTALVNHWLNFLEQKNYCGAQKIYGWSFYSRGSAEGKQASVDEFLLETLKWFGDPGPEKGSNVEKARRLAQLVQKEKCLLILDGLEPMQYPPGKLKKFTGKLKDPGLKTLLKKLSSSHPGLCVITTREKVTDLSHKTDYTVKEILLEQLSDEAGLQLLKKLGIKGSKKEILAAVKEYKGHALALTLLGNYIAVVHDGDIRKRHLIPDLTGDEEKNDLAIKMRKAISLKDRYVLNENVHDSGEAVPVGSNLKDIFESVKKQAAELLDIENFSIALYDEEKDEYRFVYHDDVMDDISESTQKKWQTGLIAYVRRTRKALRINSDLIKKLGDEGQINMVDTFPQIWLGAPLISKGKVLGVITVHSYKNENTYNDHDLTLLQNIASKVAVDVDNTMRLERCIRALEVIDNIYTISKPIDLFKTMVTQIVEELKCSHCTFFLVDKKDDELILLPQETCGHDSERIKSRYFKHGEGVAGWVLKHGQNVVITDALKDPHFVPARKRKGLSRSMLVAPVKIGNRIIGVISADQDKADWFNESDLQLVDTLTRHVGNVIERILGQSTTFIETDEEFRILVRSVLFQDDYLEGKLREAVTNKLYEKGRTYLVDTVKQMPNREKRLLDEFGYIYFDLKTPIEKERVMWRKKETQIDWRRKIWRIMSIRNTSELENLTEEKEKNDLDKDEKEKSGGDKESKIATDKTGANQTSEEKGEELENAVKKLFENFFKECSDTFTLQQVRQQKRGSQFGYDIKVACETNSNQTIRLLVECKNYSNYVKKKDVAEKLIEVEAYHEEIPIDHWILISPNADVTNDLDKMLDIWEKKGKYPFKIQFWTPANKVDNFFGMLPKLYDQIIKNPVDENHPLDWSKEKKQEVLKFWKRKLDPPIRLPTGWEEYLRDNVKILLEGESKELFEELYDRHVTMMCKDESGTLFILEEKVLEWLEQPMDNSPSLFLLGEFGDGKTFFTYVLCRKLIEEFLKSPSNGWIPVRFALKDFGMKKDDIVRDFIRRRLEEFGADIEGWTTLKRNNYKLLAILDGFDEMSKDIDAENVKRNIENLIACYNKDFKGVKLLISSRKHFFELQTEKKRLLSRIGNPQLLHLTPINRRTTENYLRDYAQRIRAEDKFIKLKQCHDPIDIASKPLFLDMVQTSIKDLPEGDFNEFILYETYIQKSLERKIEFLEDKDLITLQENIIENLKNILEDVALKLYEYNRAFIYLSEIHNDLAECLWQISQVNDNMREDAMARISSRSLLKPMGKDDGSKGKKWPVDFCHRSMREYFVARKICNMLRGDQLSEAERFLRFHGLNYEIVYFASQIMKNTAFEYEDNLMSLIEKTRGLDERALLDARRLGGNAVNLLYQYKGELPKTDWSNLVLDGANLAEADLSGKNFSYTSLVSANLDNVNFENSDFSYCNLTNVRFEETTPVNAISVSQGEELFALYNDGVIRQWNFKGMPTPAVSFAKNKIENAIKFFAYPANGFTVVNDDRLTFFDRVDDKLQQRAKFEINPNQKLLKVSHNYLLLLEEKSSRDDILKLFDLESESVIRIFEVPRYSLCEHLDRNGFVIYNEKTGLQIFDMTDEQKPVIDIKIQHEEKITCLTVCRCNEPLNGYLLGVGQNNGIVQVWKIKLPKFEPSLVFKHKSHEDVVKDIAFIDEERIISGGNDSKLKLLTFDSEEGIKYDPKEFKIKLQCVGMNVEGVERDHERKLLEGIISKTDET